MAGSMIRCRVFAGIFCPSILNLNSSEQDLMDRSQYRLDKRQGSRAWRLEYWNNRSHLNRWQTGKQLGTSNAIRQDRCSPSPMEILHSPIFLDFGENGPFSRDFLIQDLMDVLEESGIDGVVTVQARQTLAESRWLLDLAGTHDVIRGVVAWVALTDPKVDRDLEHLSTHAKLKSVRYVLHDEPDDLYILPLDPRLLSRTVALPRSSNRNRPAGKRHNLRRAAPVPGVPRPWLHR